MESPRPLASAEPACGDSDHVRTTEFPLRTLRDALASGQARYGNGAIAELSASSSPALRKAGIRIDAICRDMPDVLVGTSGVVHTATGMAFAELTLGESGYLLGCGRRQAGVLRPGRPLDIITGTCLFGADALTGTVSGCTYPVTDPPLVSGYAGNAFEAILVDERPHVYEAEIVRRLGSFIRDLTAQMSSSPVRVKVHVPVPEYEMYGLSLYARGCLTRRQCDEYRDAVRRRGRQVTAVFLDYLSGIAEVSAGSPMSWLSGVDPYSVPPGEVAGLLHRAACGQDQLWRFLAEATDGQSFQALNHASYAYQYLSAAQSVHSEGGQLAAVEDPDEIVIYRQAAVRQTATGISLNGCVRFYVHPGLVVHETAFGLRDRVLYNCQDGCSPGHVTLAEQHGPLSGVSRVGGEPDRGGPQIHPWPDPKTAAQLVARRDPRPVTDHDAVQHHALADVRFAADRTGPDAGAGAHGHLVEQHAALDLGTRVHAAAGADDGPAGELGSRLHDGARQHQGLTARARHRRRRQLAEHQVT